MIETIDDLIAFLKHYHRGRMAQPGLDPASIPTDIPPGLAAIYRELGGLVEPDNFEPGRERFPFAAQDALVGLSALVREDGWLRFCCENQGNWTCRCRAGEVDPPVYSDARDVWNEPAQGFVEVCPSLNHFLITLCLQEAVFSSEDLASVHSDRSPHDVLNPDIIPLWLNGKYVDDEADHHFFTTADRDVILMLSAGTWVGSRFLSLRKLLRDPIAARFHSEE